MKPNKKLAGLTATALVVSGVAVIALASPAQASSQNFALYSQINNTALSGPTSVGTKNVQMTVTPASGAVGSAITVSLTSTDLNFANGPAAASTVGQAELDAVISLNGVDYTLRGSQSGQTTNIGTTNNIFDAGWVVSSAAGGSSATGTNVTAPAGTAAGTTGIGATVRGAEATPVSLVAPSSAGTYTIGLKALVNNSIGGTGTALLTDNFDNIYNTDSTNAGGAAGTVGPGGTTGSFALNTGNGLTAGAGNLIFTTAVTVTAIGPNATIATSTGQPAAAQAIGRTSFINSKTVTLTGSVFPASQASGAYTVAFCTTAGASCDSTPAVSNTLTSDAGGALTGSITIPAATGLTTGNRAISITGGTLTTAALVPFLALGTPAISFTPSSGGPGTVAAVSGTNFNVSTSTGTNSIYGSTNSSTDNTTDATVSFSTDAAGAFGPINYTVGDSTTTSIVAAQALPILGAPSIAQASATALFTINSDTCTADTGNVNTGNCDTKQNVYATVLAGDLSQAAALSPGNPDNTSVVFCKTAAPSSDPGGSQPGNTTACGLSSPLAATDMYGTLNPVTVTDTRGGNFGWSLTATMPNLSDGTHSMQNSAVAITPACASVNAGSAPGAVAGAAAQTFAGTVSLCVKDTQTSAAPLSQTTGGQWTISAPLTLTVPSFQAAGQYNSTITINLA